MGPGGLVLAPELGEGLQDPSPVVVSAFSGPGVGGFLPGFLTLGAGNFPARAWLSGSSLVTVGSDGDKVLASVSMPPTNGKHGQTAKAKLQGPNASKSPTTVALHARQCCSITGSPQIRTMGAC